MRKKLQRGLAAAVSGLFLLMLVGCGGADTADTTGSTEPETTGEEVVFEERNSEIAGIALDAQPLEVHIYDFLGASDEMLVGTVGDGSVLAYYDFDRTEWIPFCSNSSCSHNSDSCNAWLGLGSYGGFMQVGDFVWYFAAENDYSDIYLMRFDIQAQQYGKVLELTWGEDVVSADVGYLYYYVDEDVYFIQNTMTQSEDGLAQCSYLVDVDLNSGAVRHCIRLPNVGMGFCGIYDTTALLDFYEFTDEETLTQNEYYAIYGAEGDYSAYLLDCESRLVFLALDLDTETYSTLASFEDYDAVDYPADWDLYGEYFFLSEGDTVWAYSVKTGEGQVLFSGGNNAAYLESVIDHFLFYIDSSDGSGAESRHCIYDLDSGLGYDLGTYNYEGNPYSATDQYLLQERMQFISKEDYYAGNWDGWTWF